MSKKVKIKSDPNNALTEATELTLEYQRNMAAILDNPVQQGIFANVNASINRMVNQLNHLNGQAPQHQATTQQFPPITNFMGEEISTPKQLEAEDLSPTEEQRQRYVGRVKQLEAEFDSLDDNGIINGYTTPEDVSILRGVAKRANVEGYEDRTIDVQFIGDIRKGMANVKADAGTEAAIEKQLKGSTVEGGNVSNPGTSATNVTDMNSIPNVAKAAGVADGPVMDKDGTTLGNFAQGNETKPEGTPGK